MKRMQLTTTPTWAEAASEGLFTGAIAGVLSAVTVAIAGRRDSGSAIAPINAVSHWLWGPEAGQSEAVSARYTAVGAVTHVLSAMFWATLHARFRPRGEEGTVPAAIAGGVATSAVAAVVDYGLVPKRITPGWEERIGTPSMVAAFVAIAAGVAVGTVLADRRR